MTALFHGLTTAGPLTFESPVVLNVRSLTPFLLEHLSSPAIKGRVRMDTAPVCWDTYRGLEILVDGSPEPVFIPLAGPVPSLSGKPLRAVVLPANTTYCRVRFECAPLRPPLDMLRTPSGVFVRVGGLSEVLPGCTRLDCFTVGNVTLVVSELRECFRRSYMNQLDNGDGFRVSRVIGVHRGDRLISDYFPGVRVTRSHEETVADGTLVRKGGTELELPGGARCYTSPEFPPGQSFRCFVLESGAMLAVFGAPAPGSDASATLSHVEHGGALLLAADLLDQPGA